MTQAPTPTADTVRRLVRSLLKDNTPGAGEAGGPEVRPVDEGGAPTTWWVGSRHVLRLAPDREATLRRRRELRLRDLVRPHVPIAVPTSIAHGEWSPGLACTLDTRLPGGTAEEHDVSASPDCSGDCARCRPGRPRRWVCRVPPRARWRRCGGWR